MLRGYASKSEIPPCLSLKQLLVFSLCLQYLLSQLDLTSSLAEAVTIVCSKRVTSLVLVN